MKSDKDFDRINQASEQKDQAKKDTHKDAESVELDVTELEERIAPITVGKKLGA